MNIIVTGGNFANKGAQTMLLITMSEIVKHFPDAKLYYTSSEKYDVKIENIYSFKYLYKFKFLNSLGSCGNGFKGKKKCFYKITSLIRMILKRNWKHIKISEQYYKKIIKNTAFIFDISGYTLSSKFKKFNYIATEYYLDLIEYAHSCNIRIVLLPQSFGPFEYGEKKPEILDRMKRILPLADMIFAREESGYDLLTRECSLKNVYLADDLVLQTSKIDISLIADITNLDFSVPGIFSVGNVAIIPNKRVFERFSSPKEFYCFYDKMIEIILSRGKNIYLIWHSNEDKKICEKIKKHFQKENRVIFICQELAFYQYEKIIQYFDYIISSRFHAIVHAYRYGIPCICLGWADKYQNLLDRCGQHRYMLDVEKTRSSEQICKIIGLMEELHNYESDVIKEKVNQIQSNNCFEIIFRDMKNKMENK